MLRFSPLKNNAKLSWIGKKSYSFSLLSGWSCPHAVDCKSKVIETPEGRRIQDGPHIVFRCFSSSQEVLFKTTYEQRKHNYEELKKVCGSKDEMVKLLEESLPKDAKFIRIHISGDYFTQSYFDAWLQVARNHPEIHFWSYTKAIIFWVKRLDSIPDNFILTGSLGGSGDTLIDQYKLRYCKVVMSESEAKSLKLPIDTTDKYAMLPKHKNKNFALVVHGPGPKGSKHALAWNKQIKGKRKFHGYNKETTMKT